MTNLEHLESAALSFLAENLDANTAVSFSGGKDSLVALDLASRLGVRNAVFSDTSIEFEETIRYIHEISALYDIVIDTVRAPIDFFSIIESVTLPSRIQRWCCEVFKFGPLTSWAAEKGVTSFITGLRRNESNRRKEYRHIDENPRVPVVQLNPLLDWSEEDVWDYINMYELPVNPLYTHFSRVGCWCCPFKGHNEWATLELHYPQKIEFFTKKLYNLAERLRIKDKESFVKKGGWKHWIHSTGKISIGAFRLCGGGLEERVVITGSTFDQLHQIAKLLPALTSDFRIISKRMRINARNISKQRLRILTERAMNCIGCGACLGLCPEGALYLDDGHIAVDIDKCTHCLICLNASKLKGSCISRHYRPKRLAHVVLHESNL